MSGNVYGGILLSLFVVQESLLYRLNINPDFLHHAGLKVGGAKAGQHEGVLPALEFHDRPLFRHLQQSPALLHHSVAVPKMLFVGIQRDVLLAIVTHVAVFVSAVFVRVHEPVQTLDVAVVS